MDVRSDKALSWPAEYSLLWYLVEKNLKILRTQSEAADKDKKLLVELEILVEPFERDLRKLVIEARKTAKSIALVTFSTRIRANQSDYGCLTILCQDDVGGLEVQTRLGEWVTAYPIEGTFVVNVGDLLARWTNDSFASTPHRVINKSGRERYSLVVAVDPDYDTMIDPSALLAEGVEPHYPPVLCGDYILERFDKAFSYRKK